MGETFGNYDAHLARAEAKAASATLMSDSRADAECAVIDADKRWLRDNLDKIRELYVGWHTAVIDAWYETTTEEMGYPDDLPTSEMRDLMDAAIHEDRQNEYQKRQGRHLGNL